jgi:UDP-N-acetylglucosamine 2-epimerase (non-hydrolysing)
VRRLVADGRRIVVVTAHRRESFGAPLRGIFEAVRALADRHADVLFVVPLHPNPAVRSAAVRLRGHERIRLMEPLGYADLLHLLSRAALVLTDSGGLQEEAPSLGAPVLVLRDVTERPEGLGTVAELVGTDPDRIVAAAGELLSNETARAALTRHPNPYGDGEAAARIADIIINHLTGRPRQTTDWEGVEPLLRSELEAVQPSARGAAEA